MSDVLLTILIYFPLIMYHLTPSPARIESFLVPFMDGSRRITVYLPRGYDTSELDYPTLYMPDGQVYVGEVPADFIVVGVDSEWQERWDSLSPWVQWQMPLWFGISSPRGGRGDEYLTSLLDVKDIIDERYRTKTTREYTAIGGCSMGGFFAIYAGLERPDIFSKVVAFSPAVWFGSRNINQWLTQNNLIDFIYRLDDVDFWIYQGGNESHDAGYPKTGLDFPTVYTQGATKAHELLGGEFLFNRYGQHSSVVFLCYFDEAFAWLDTKWQ